MRYIKRESAINRCVGRVDSAVIYGYPVNGFWNLFRVLQTSCEIAFGLSYSTPKTVSMLLLFYLFLLCIVHHALCLVRVSPCVEDVLSLLGSADKEISSAFLGAHSTLTDVIKQYSNPRTMPLTNQAHQHNMGIIRAAFQDMEVMTTIHLDEVMKKREHARRSRFLFGTSNQLAAQKKTGINIHSPGRLSFRGGSYLAADGSILIINSPQAHFSCAEIIISGTNLWSWFSPDVVQDWGFPSNCEEHDFIDTQPTSSRSNGHLGMFIGSPGKLWLDEVAVSGSNLTVNFSASSVHFRGRLILCVVHE